MAVIHASNRTAEFDELLKQYGAPKTRGSLTVDQIDDFSKEAYRIYSRISSLLAYLKDIRQAYLSTAQQPRSALRARRNPNNGNTPLHLTDYDREQIDAETKQVLRDLNASIRRHEEAEDLYQRTQQALIQKEHGSALAALGKWAPSGVLGKTPEHVAAEDRLRALEAHRESMLWFLKQRLQGCVELQKSMMEARLRREMEKNRSVLAKANMGDSFAAFQKMALGENGAATGGGNKLSVEQLEKEQRTETTEGLTDEQMQMFAKGNQDMLKHYETTLDKVRTAEKSLLEISELQNVLLGNLEVQAAHVEQLVNDSINTTENVGKGNKELKKALERPSTARYTFFAAGGLCLFMIVWDLII